jgi:stage III sporulation protein AA
MSDSFEGALYGVCPEIRAVLEALPENTKKKVNEIRLRKNKPLALTIENETKFLSRNGVLCDYVNQNAFVVTPEALNESFRLCCGGAVFAHENELNRGFIALKNGCRCGVAGVYRDGRFISPTSLNVRIAREISGAADKLLCKYSQKGLLIAGPPASGKTTILRDLIKQLSGGFSSGGKRVAVVDSRNELCGGNFDLGPNTDIIFCESKSFGALMAVRTLFPEILAFDEIGTEEELQSLEQCFFAGVSVITTAHIGAVSELLKRKVTRRLLETDVISQVAVLPRHFGGEIKFYSTKEILNGYF